MASSPSLLRKRVNNEKTKGRGDNLRPFLFLMDIRQAADIVKKIADGFEDACLKALQSASDDAVRAVSEQLMSGLDGEDAYLEPTYDEDPYFQEIKWYLTENGVRYHGSEGYKRWKETITKPKRGPMLDLPARPVEVPNLWIDGTFHGSIHAVNTSLGIDIRATGGRSAEIVGKYGEGILMLGTKARKYMLVEHIIPGIDDFLNKCGYR